MILRRGMRLAFFLVAILTLAPVTGCLDGLNEQDLPQDIKPGCTYKEAINYDETAQIDDGSCILREPILGCTYEDATNYNTDAEVDDGKCEFPEPVEGCTDKTASNYNPYAEINNDSCEYPIEGCMDEDADNYNSLAKKEDGSCEYPLEGCTDKDADNYNEDAEVDDDSCKYKGCTYDDADNYDENATVDDGSCAYSEPVFGCTDPDASNYNSYATHDNSTCEYETVIYESLTNDEINDFLNEFFNDDEMKDFTGISEDFDRFGSKISLNLMAMLGDMFGEEEGDEDDEGNGDEEEEEGEMPEDMIISFSVEKDDVNQILTATMGIQMGMEGMDMFDTGSEDGIVQMEMLLSSVRQGPNCTSGNCELTNEETSVKMYMDAESPGAEMSMAMYMLQTTYSRDEKPYYGNPVAELPGGGSLLFGMDEEARVEIYREDENVTYDPTDIEVEIGDTVFWFNGDDSASHTVTATDGSFDSGDIESGDDWSWTFEEEGTFSYYSNKAYDKDFEGDPKVKGQVIVKDPAFDFEWDIETHGLDTNGDGKDDWIEHVILAWDNEENQTLSGKIRETEDGKLYPGQATLYDINETLLFDFLFWYDDEVQIEIIDGEAEGFERNSAKFVHRGEQYDNETSAQNVYEGTINPSNEEEEMPMEPSSNYTQEVKNDEMQIRVLEMYEGAEDDDPFGDPFGGDEEEEEGGIDNARVVARMTLSDGEADMEDPETGCHWYIKWRDNDADGLVSTGDDYEIKSDKVDDEGEDCPRVDEEGKELYVIKFFDVWADAYTDGPNPALQLPGFSAIFALLSILGMAIVKRRKSG